MTPKSWTRKYKLRSAMGTLLYLSQVRVDFQHAEFMAKPPVSAEMGVKHLILYLILVSYFLTEFLVTASWMKLEVAQVPWGTRRSWWKHSRMLIGLETNQPQQGNDTQCHQP